MSDPRRAQSENLLERFEYLIGDISSRDFSVLAPTIIVFCRHCSFFTRSFAYQGSAIRPRPLGFYDFDL